MAGVPTLNAAERARELSLLRDEMANNPGIIRKMVAGLTDLPKRASEGEWVRPGGETLGYALNMVSPQALAPVKGGLGIFGGKMAKTANHNMLDMAKAMEKAGSKADTIWEATGWGKGKDGQWRFEIDDSGAWMTNALKEKIDAGETAQLNPGRGPEKFYHKELYEAYPELKDTTLNKDNSGNYGTYYGKIGGKHDIALASRFRPDMQSTLLHELQHAVQGIEGFARGGNTGMFKEIYDAAKTGRINEAMELINQRSESLWKKGRASSAEVEEINKLQSIIPKLLQMRDDVIKRGVSPYEQYRRLAGETESRNVQTRESWDAQHRSDVPPEFSEDVPRSRQKVINQDGSLGDMLVRAMGNRS
jgi:hypothetical protein